MNSLHLANVLISQTAKRYKKYMKKYRKIILLHLPRGTGKLTQQTQVKHGQVLSALCVSSNSATLSEVAS